MTQAVVRWDYYAAELTTGAIQVDLPLVDFSGEVNLQGDGPMDASLPLAHLGYDQRRALLAATIPGRYTIVAMRDGVVRGEWAIWKRTRRNNFEPIRLAGAELLSYANRRLMRAMSWTQTEQLDIAKELVLAAFGGSAWSPVGAGAVALTIASYPPSGQLRDRAWKALDGSFGARLRELSEVANGFDLTITPEWSNLGTGQVLRTLRFAYPQAGADLGLMMEMAGAGFQTLSSAGSSGGNVLDFQDEEDATNLASRTSAIGETTADVTLTGTYHDTALVAAGYPFYERSSSFTTVKEQPTIDAYARALWLDSQTPTRVINLLALADAPPAVGTYSLGDIITANLDPSVNYPDGFQGRVRIVGWVFEPPTTGPATIRLKVTQELTP